MPTVKAYAAQNSKAPLTPFSLQRRDPREHDVVIGIKYCGICHSDIHQVHSDWGEGFFPMVPGHEIAGIVTQVGPAVRKFKVGDAVGVGCMVDSCRKCENCQKGLEQYCLGDGGPSWTYNGKDRNGAVTQGGYAQSIVVDENFVLRMPKELPLDAAAPLLCAGVTLYSPLKHWKAGPGKKVAIIGLGGLGHIGVKLAHAMGADVTVLSQSDKKKEDAKRLGADHFYATASPDTFKKLKNTFDLIINTVSANIDLAAYLDLVKTDGSLVLLGVPDKPHTVPTFSLVGGRRELAGSAIGGIRETQEMLDFCAKNKITCDIEMTPIQKVNEAYTRVQKSDVRYRFVIDIATL
jgi:uncharacterized zinc-type alcohol dehydrogenase-like protein